MDELTSEHDALYERVVQIVEAARGQVARTVNTATVQAYWLIGREIVEVQQKGQQRAEYGEQLLKGLSKRLSRRFSRGMGVATLRRARSFYLTYPAGSSIPSDVNNLEIRSTALIKSDGDDSRGVENTGIRSTALIKSDGRELGLFPPQLSWSHYLALIRVKRDDARSFYEIEAAREGWSVRELERQIASLLFERLTRSRDKDEVMALAKEGQTVASPSDVIKDPFVLEFLGLQERTSWQERDLEQAIIDRLEAFLLELGKGFCFVARQKRITLDADHFYIDLVFYNRLLRCFVLIDLKLGKLTHQDLGQMQMYVNYFDRFQRAEHEEPTVGIVLCSDKNDAVVKITLPDNHQIIASQYQLYLPTEDELRAELERERQEAERNLRLATREHQTAPERA